MADSGQPACPLASPWKILLIDDDDLFADLMEMQVEDHYPGRAHIEIIVPKDGDDVEAIISSRIIQSYSSDRQPFDVVLVDQNIPAFGGLDILRLLQKLKTDILPARFLPVVMITASEQGARDADARKLGALRFMHKSGEGSKSKAPTAFLYQVMLSLPELRAQSEDQIWMNFIQESSQAFNDSSPIKDSLAKSAEFLERYLAAEATYIRVKHEEELILYGGRDIFNAGDHLAAAAVPFLQDLLAPDGPDYFLSEALSDTDLGRLPTKTREELRCMRAAAVPILGGTERLGTIALYRNPQNHPFRDKDIHNLKYFGLLISSRMGRDAERLRVRERQRTLAEFVVQIAEAKEENELLSTLLDLLHAELHDGEGNFSKSTVRLIVPGTNRIPRAGWRGLPPLADLDDLCFDQIDSVYPKVISQGKAERIPDVTKHPEPYRAGHPDIRSEMAVPLLAGDCCLGAVNLEHRYVDRYDESDQKFVEAVSRIAANGLVALRAGEFLRNILDLIDHLLKRECAIDPERLLEDAFAALYHFVGYARLLYLKPSDTPKLWAVERVVGLEGATVEQSEFLLWQKHVFEHWADTFACKTLITGRVFTCTPDDIAQDEQLGVARSMMVVHLAQDGVVVGMLALMFRQGLSLNGYQRSVLDVFGRFLGSLLQAGQHIKTLFNERTIAGQMAVLGQALGQLRHRLRNELGGIGNALNEARAQGIDGDWAENIRDILDAVDTELTNSRFLIKPPDEQQFLVPDIWARVTNICKGRANLQQVPLMPFTGPTNMKCVSDPDIVALILENLVQNAIEAFADETDRRIWLEATEAEDGLALTVCDSGPGIPPAHRAKLFGLGFTTKSTGTGFALHFSRRRAKDLGGSLTFDEERLQKAGCPGSAFTLKLPVGRVRENGNGRS